MSLLLLLLACSVDFCRGADLQHVYGDRGDRGGLAGPSDEVLMPPRKRPFCNAFTGCGRKRSAAAPGMPLPLMRQRQVSDEELSNTLEDEATQDLTRQLLYEARMLEAIQEASQELYRRRLMYPQPYNLQ